MYVSAFGRFDLAVPQELLQQLVPGCDIDDDILYRAPTLLERAGRYITTPRHTEWTELAIAVDARRNPRANRYETIIDKSPHQYERLIARLLFLLLRKDPNLDHLLKRAFNFNHFSIAVFPHMLAMQRKRRGDVAGTRRAFEFAVSRGVADAAIFQALGMLEKEQAKTEYEEGRIDAARQSVNRARKLLKRAIKADSSMPHAWTELGRLECDEGNFGTVNDPWSARRVFERGYRKAGAHCPLIRAWILAEKESPDCNFGYSVDDKYSFAGYMTY